MAATLTTMLDGATTVSESVPLSLRSVRSRDEVLVQVDIAGGSATVELHGRASKRLPFLLLTTTTVSAIIPVARMAELKAKVTIISGATVNADAYLDE